MCSKDELWEAAKEEEMKIPWKEAQEELPVPEDQYQERFWRRRLDGIGLDTVNRELLAIEFKRTQDMRSNYAEEATKVAQKQYSSLLEGPHSTLASHVHVPLDMLPTLVMGASPSLTSRPPFLCEVGP